MHQNLINILKFSCTNMEKKQIQTNTWTRGVNLVGKIYFFIFLFPTLQQQHPKGICGNKQILNHSWLWLSPWIENHMISLLWGIASTYIHITYLPIFGIRVTDYYNKENSNCNRSIIILFLKLSYFLHYFHVNVNLVFILIK